MKKKNNVLFFYLSIFLITIFIPACSGSREIDFSQIQGGNGIIYVVGEKQPYTGKIVEYYEENPEQKKQEFFCKNGKRDGLSTEWYQNGIPLSKMTFKDGTAEGLSTTWYQNGQKHFEMTFKDGKIHGLATTWNIDGTILDLAEYVNGEIVNK